MREAWKLLLCAAALSSAVLRAPAAQAVPPDEAQAIVEKAKKEDLWAALERRAVPEPAGGGRAIESDLHRLSDIELIMASRAAQAKGRVIYGFDDRRDWYQIRSDAALRRLGGASVALFDTRTLLPQGIALGFSAKSLAEDYQLCADEEPAFARQSVGAFCSGTLIGTDTVLTAGHCVREISGDPRSPALRDIRFVFGYRVETQGQAATTRFSTAQVFSGGSVYGEMIGDHGSDWAIIGLDRSVPQNVAIPVTQWHAQQAQAGDGVFVMGYPSGLPLKYAPGAEIRSAENPSYFVANLDTFGGNSGSGVFLKDTGELVGVLVRGEADYVRDPVARCNRVNLCPAVGGGPSCRGEEVTRISIVPHNL